MSDPANTPETATDSRTPFRFDAILAVPAAIFVLLLFVGYLAVTRLEFGAWNPLVLWLVRGTWTDQVALIEPDWASVVYDSEPADGPGVGILRTSYRTRAAPGVVLERFTHGCARIGLTVEADESPAPDGSVLRSCARGELVIVLQVTGQDVVVREDVP